MFATLPGLVLPNPAPTPRQKHRHTQDSFLLPFQNFPSVPQRTYSVFLLRLKKKKKFTNPCTVDIYAHFTYEYLER